MIKSKLKTCPPRIPPNDSGQDTLCKLGLRAGLRGTMDAAGWGGIQFLAVKGWRCEDLTQLAGKRTRIEDLFPIKNGDIAACYVSFRECK